MPHPPQRWSADGAPERPAKVEISVTALSTLIQTAEAMKAANVALRGQLAANGPGGRGTSSPDAGAGGGGAAQ